MISDALSANARALKVKMGSKASHRVWKLSFGDYAVGKDSSRVKEGTVSATTKEAKKKDIWRRISNTQTRYAFTLSDGQSNLATVEAVDDVSVEEVKTVIRELHFLNPEWWLESESFLLYSTETHWDPDEDSSRSRLFSAVIDIGAEAGQTWVLLMAFSDGWQPDPERKASLSNGERHIQIVGASSNKHGADPRTFPALGYEFVEGERTLGALQYTGGGLMKYHKNLIWIDSRLDRGMQLILAAAMTSLLQLPGIGMPEDFPDSK